MRMNELDRARYISLTTFKRDGSPIATPVWITGSHGLYVFTTGDTAWKTRRLRNNPAVRAQVCNVRGTPKQHATIFAGTGTVSAAADAVAAAEHALAAKYGWQFRATKIVDSLRARFRPAARQDVVAIELALPEAASDHS
jgi:PPOX class probable F420-dependent enzyme